MTPNTRTPEWEDGERAACHEWVKTIIDVRDQATMFIRLERPIGTTLYRAPWMNAVWQAWLAARAMPVTVDEGMVLVPREPTQAMVTAGDMTLGSDNRCECDSERVWPAMIAASQSNNGEG